MLGFYCGTTNFNFNFIEKTVSQSILISLEISKVCLLPGLRGRMGDTPGPTVVALGGTVDRIFRETDTIKLEAL